MKCPYCSSLESKVIDSRLAKEETSIRRRRECLDCKSRFTTYERVEEVELLVVKKGGVREPFDRSKIIAGMIKACEKRPISMEVIESFVSGYERELQERGEREVDSSEIGERVISKLYEIDEVAYVRFASVYRSFKDVNQFMNELKELLKEKGGKGLGDSKDAIHPLTLIQEKKEK
ncbi:MAG: transcriptional regulator NrdR [Candidatus Dadabacteria bacterium]|nr:transcriptional regulator NrdR [Candidatus Dadabacteria bacterium]